MKKTNYLTILLSSFLVLFLSLNATAATDEEMQELKNKIATLEKRVQELETEKAASGLPEQEEQGGSFFDDEDDCGMTHSF